MLQYVVLGYILLRICFLLMEQAVVVNFSTSNEAIASINACPTNNDN